MAEALQELTCVRRVKLGTGRRGRGYSNSNSRGNRNKKHVEACLRSQLSNRKIRGSRGGNRGTDPTDHRRGGIVPQKSAPNEIVEDQGGKKSSQKHSKG